MTTELPQAMRQAVDAANLNLPEDKKLQLLNNLTSAAVNIDQLNMNDWNRTKDLWQGGLATLDKGLQGMVAIWSGVLQDRMLDQQWELVKQRGTEINNAYLLQDKMLGLEYEYKNKIADNSLEMVKNNNTKEKYVASLDAKVKMKSIDKDSLHDLFYPRNQYGFGVPTFPYQS